MSAKEKFMAACEEWADLLIGDSERHVQDGGARWTFGAAQTVDEWVPRLVGFDGGPFDLPDAQKKVWAAGYQLMLDAYDEAKSR